MPTSRGRLRYQRTISSPIAATSVEPVASTVSTVNAICVSSVHSPGSQRKPPPPSIAHGADGFGGPNSYGAPSASPTAEAITAPTARSIVAEFIGPSLPGADTPWS